MNAQQIRDLKPKLDRFLHEFDDCFAYESTKSHLETYVDGQLSDLPRKSVEPIALKAGVPPRTLQEFLSLLKWDQDLMRDKIEQRVATRYPSLHSVGVIDDTGCPKKGIHSPGVQRQWCGASGKTDNCQVSVHLSYAADDFHTMLDGELYLPKSWSEDRERCHSCGIPDDLAFRPKWQIALELYDRAIKNGIVFRYLTFDEAYGGNPLFLRSLTARNQFYVAEVPRTFFGWLGEPPAVTTRSYRKGIRGGKRRSKPRLVAGHRRARSVESHFKFSPELKDQSWTLWRVKDGEKGPMVWETKHAALFPRDAHGLPSERLHVIVARNVLCPEELKYFISNAPETTSLGEMLLVAFTRWTVERCFEDEKMELGFDHFEGRTYVGLKRHQTISALTHLFLAETRQGLRGKKSGRNAESIEAGARRTGPVLVGVPRVSEGADRSSRQAN